MSRYTYLHKYYVHQKCKPVWLFAIKLNLFLSFILKLNWKIEPQIQYYLIFRTSKRDFSRLLWMFTTLEGTLTTRKISLCNRMIRYAAIWKGYTFVPSLYTIAYLSLSIIILAQLLLTFIQFFFLILVIRRNSILSYEGSP